MTKLGIISDSHGRTARTRQALHLLLARGAERIIHLGDVESEAILDLLVGHDATVVFGNCDDERSLSAGNSGAAGAPGRRRLSGRS